MPYNSSGKFKRFSPWTRTLLTGLLKLDSSGYFSSCSMKLKRGNVEWFETIYTTKFTFGLFVNSSCDCINNLGIIFLGGSVAVGTVGSWTSLNEKHSNNNSSNYSPRSSWSDSGSLLTGWIGVMPATWLDSNFFKSCNIGWEKITSSRGSSVVWSVSHLQNKHIE